VRACACVCVCVCMCVCVRGDFAQACTIASSPAVQGLTYLTGLHQLPCWMSGHLADAGPGVTQVLSLPLPSFGSMTCTQHWHYTPIINITTSRVWLLTIRVTWCHVSPSIVIIILHICKTLQCLILLWHAEALTFMVTCRYSVPVVSPGKTKYTASHEGTVVYLDLARSDTCKPESSSVCTSVEAICITFQCSSSN
jgi:hypothetical protein